jgi:hypothetical protein
MFEARGFDEGNNSQPSHFVIEMVISDSGSGPSDLPESMVSPQPMLIVQPARPLL